MKSLAKNSKYTSNIIQNDIIVQTIIKEVNGDGSVYSLIVDEARDVSTLEHMSICIRYVHKSITKERFLGFVKVIKYNDILMLVKIYNINFRFSFRLVYVFNTFIVPINV